MRLIVSKNFMFLLILLLLIQPVQARVRSDFNDTALVCMNATQKFEKKYNIKEHLLTTITNVETGRWNEKHQQKLAWPWTINAQGKGYFFETKAEAVREVKRLQKAGVKSIDVGCMQINLAFHPEAFKNVEEALDPQKNVEYGAQFLTSLYKRKGNDWIKAATAYHSSLPRKAKVYKKKLANTYESLKQAMLDKPYLFGKSAQKPTKKLVSDRLYAKNKIEAKVENAANAWREARLKEYRQRKTAN